jgi:hypothetical protein
MNGKVLHDSSHVCIEDLEENHAAREGLNLVPSAYFKVSQSPTFMPANVIESIIV